MSTLDMPALLGAAQAAMDKAVETLMHSQHAEVRTKGDRDLVTDVELGIEHLVRDHLQEHSPDIGFLGEETGAAGDPNVYWVLDPVDGTANFVHGVPLCAVVLGLVQSSQPVLGVVDLPFIGHRYWAVRGGGAFRNGKPIAVSGTSAIGEAMISLSDYGKGDGGAVRIRTSFELDRALTKRAQRVRRLGSSAVELVWVADGTLDASLTLGNHSWDTAAGAVIALEAGALVVDADGSPHSTNSRSVIATTPARQDTLLPLVQIVRGTPYWPAPTPIGIDHQVGGSRQSAKHKVGTTTFKATIGIGIGDDDTVDAITEVEFFTSDEARSWIEQTLPETEFPEWVKQRPFGPAGAFILGSIQQGSYVAVPDDVAWVPKDSTAEDLDAVLAEGRVRWCGSPDAAV
ncbi:inositol monophosphatase family protein [Amycolatopsis sp. cmx-11-12]|uniref:inositol monophosphatase family protein n=1 Tax=Amycolatopsis sp. cmx-11-12 TaxID=2785795 RepID=UPI00391861C4